MFDPSKMRERVIQNLVVRLGEAMNRVMKQHLEALKAAPNVLLTFQMTDKNCLHQFTFTLEYIPPVNGQTIEDERVDASAQLTARHGGSTIVFDFHCDSTGNGKFDMGQDVTVSDITAWNILIHAAIPEPPPIPDQIQG